MYETCLKMLETGKMGMSCTEILNYQKKYVRMAMTK